MQKRTSKNIYYLSVTSLMLAATTLLTVAGHADTVTDRISIMIPSSCSMTGTLVSDHQADIVNGQYLDGIGTTKLNAFCNDRDGFSIYAVGYSSNEYGNNYLVDSASRTNLNISTGIATSGPSSNWAMRITLDESNPSAASIVNGFDSYSAVPSNYTQVAKRESSTDTGTLAQGVKFNTSYATFISSTQAAGAYQGKVKYTLVHPHSEVPAHSIDTEGGLIAYYPNTNIYEGSMGQQTVEATDTSATLLAPNFSREGYGFAGWNTAYDYSGEFYGPNETITFTTGEYAEKGLSLYAVWVESEGFIQDWQGCSNMAIGDTTALTDERDGQTYAIAKLADGKCWTIENLRLNTVDYETLLAGSQSLDPTFTNFPSSTNTWSSNASELQYNDANSSRGYGSYYSWSLAVANTGINSGNNISLNTSICPKNWRLPIGGQTVVTSGDYYNLFKALIGTEPNQNASSGYGYYSADHYSDTSRRYPNNFVLSGKWDDDDYVNQGSGGYYWTSTSNDGGNSYYLYIDQDIIRPGNGQSPKYNGLSIRCVNNS